MTDIPYRVLYRYYVTFGMTPREIAPRVGLTKWQVTHQLRKQHIPMRPRGSHGFKTLAQMTATRNEAKEMKV